MSVYSDLGTVAHAVLEDGINLLTLGICADLRTTVEPRIGERITIDDSAHDRLSPSGAKQWMSCPASPRMSEGVVDPDDIQGERSYALTQEYADAVIICMEYIQRRLVQLTLEEYPGHSVLVVPEKRVSPEPYLGTADCDGTADITLLVRDPEGVLVFIEIVDFKAGFSIPVSPEDPQLHLYLLGALAEEGVPAAAGSSIHARLTICQPRCPEVPNIQSLTFSADDALTTFLSEVRSAIGEANAENPVFNPSPEACRFCRGQRRKPPCKHAVTHALRHSGVMPALSEKASEYVDAGAAFAARDPHGLTQEQIRGLLDMESMISDSFKAIRAVTQSMIRQGTADPVLTDAYKLVRSSAPLSFQYDENGTARALKRISIMDPVTKKTRKLGKKDLYIVQLRPASQIHDLLRECFKLPKDDARMDAFFLLTDKKEGTVTLAPVSDPRTAVPPLVRDAETAQR